MTYPGIWKCPICGASGENWEDEPHSCTVRPLPRFTAADQIFWAMVADPKATTETMAVCYALLIPGGAGSGGEFWGPINRAVNDRFGWKLPEDVRKIDRLRKRAWSIHAAATAIKSRPQ